jgi:HEAT repeat protein
MLCEVAAADPSRQVRCSAIWALVRIDLESERVKKALLTALASDAEPTVRAAAAGGLEIRPAPVSEEIIHAFARGLKDSDPLVRQICAAALGKCGRRATLALERLRSLAESNDEAADYAKSALRQIENSPPAESR